MLKQRAGFTLVELMVSLVLTAIIGAALTGVFVTHAKFFDGQEKVAFARGVSHSGMNLIVSELRMLETSGGIISATNTKLSIKAPYAMGLVCGTSGGKIVISRLPVDSMLLVNAVHKGYAYRTSPTTFNYHTASITYATSSTSPTSTFCKNASVATVDSSAGSVNQRGITGEFGGSLPGTPPTPGQTVFLYQHVTYEFKASVAVPGTIALWRTVDTNPLTPIVEELVAPFDTTAKFRFYINDSATPQTAVPGSLNTITGIELTLDALSERPDRNGNRFGLPLKTSVFFKNRM